MSIFKPNLWVHSFLDIDINKLKDLGIKGVIVDIDNTLVPHNYPTPNANISKFFNVLKEAGIKACLVSNNKKARVTGFNETLGLPYIANAKKPLKYGYKKAMRIMGITKDETAMIGDQLFSDIWGGNRLNLFTILVIPIKESGEGLFINLKRKLEKRVMRGVEKNDEYRR